MVATASPPAPPDTAPPPAQDWPSANTSNFQSVVDVLQQALAAGLPTDAKTAISTNWLVVQLVRFIQVVILCGGILVKDTFEAVFPVLMPILQTLLDTAFQDLGPVKELFAALSRQYVGLFVDEQRGYSPGHPRSATTPIGGVASAAFDGILAPLGFLGGGSDPSQAGSGFANSQYVLGSLVNLHLSTWVVNVLSNLLGLGALHFINSFDEVILSAMNTRAFGRLAFRPYLDMFMVQPTKRDLNLQHPLQDPGPESIIKAYVRGELTAEQMKYELRKKGLNDEYSAAILVDTAAKLSVSHVAYLVNHGYWTDEQGIEYLTHLGYPDTLANVVLYDAKYQGVKAIHARLADEAVSQYADHVIDLEEMQMILEQAELPKIEIDAMTVLAKLRANRPRHLSYSQVKEAFLEGVIDLSYVHHWLEVERYTPEDVIALTLLDFSTRDERHLRRAQMGARDRLRSLQATENAAKAKAKAEQAIADAYNRLAAKYGDLASKYGG